VQKKYSFNNLGLHPAKMLYPVIKIDELMTYAPWREIDCSGVVVKAQDLLSPAGTKTNKYFESIKRAGGIHEYLSCETEVVLSSIMPDKMILGFSADAYADMIDVLQPDSYYTPDGETYLTKEWISRKEINRVFSDTQFLLRSFPYIKPIGLVKGCNIPQIDDHTNRLLRSGISHFVFHAGDYICRGSSFAIEQAIIFAGSIRQKVPWLVINGGGAMSTLKNFSFADGFVTQSHFVDAFYGRFRDESRTKDEKRSVTRLDIMNNLRNIQRNVTAIQLQKRLTDWIIIDGTESTERYGMLNDFEGHA
jgi:hypothetical protein